MRRWNSSSQPKQNFMPKTPPSTQGPRVPVHSNMVSQTEQPDPPPLGSDQFQALKQAISGCQTMLTAKIDQMQAEMGLIRHDMDKYWDRLSEAERRVSDMEDVVRDLVASLRTLQLKMKTLELRVEDQENRNRRNNLRLVGLPEGV